MNNFTFKVRTFRAIDDPEGCRKYLEGHRKILRLFGLSMITSASPEWVDDPDTYVISVESPDGNKIYGGGRIQVASGNLSLPLEIAITKTDPTIHNTIDRYAEEGTGELCGLWNSREMAANGVGSLHLGRAIVAIAGGLNLRSLFALCAPATVRNCLRVGFEIARFIGDNGRLAYPKDDLLATAMLINDLENLPSAVSGERKIILNMRHNPIQHLIEPGLNGQILDMRYDLRLREAVPAYRVA